MIFIIDKAPPASCSSETEQQLQNIILKSLLKVTTKYKPVSMIQTFPSSLLNQLLSRALSLDPKTRLIVQQIFHQLLDRHKNLSRLNKPVTLHPPDKLTIEKADRYDINFMRKHGHDILVHVYKNIQIESNQKENFESIFTTMALICVEMNSDEVLIDLLRLTFALQDLAISKTNDLSDEHRCYVHCVVAGFLHLFSNLKAIPAICAHVEQVIKTRADQSENLLPDFWKDTDETDTKQPSLYKHRKQSKDLSSILESSEELLFNRNVISEALQNTGHDVSALNTPFQSNSDVDSSMTRSTSDLNAITVEIDSVNSSPGLARKFPEQEINFTTFKEVMMSSECNDKKQDSRKRINLLNQYKNAKFEDLVLNSTTSNKRLHDVLNSSIKSPLYEHQKQQRIMVKRDVVDNNEIQPKNNEHKSDSIMYRSYDLNWNVYENPFSTLCDMRQIDETRAPPLFVIKFPNLFVY